MAAPTTADMFTGVSQREYSASIAVDFVGTVRTYLVALTVEQTFTFEGLTESQALSTTDVDVTDVGGAQYTVPFKQSFKDGSTGYAICPQEQVEVQRDKMSPRMWRVTVTRRGTTLKRYYTNGTATEQIFGAPSWAQPFI